MPKPKPTTPKKITNLEDLPGATPETESEAITETETEAITEIRLEIHANERALVACNNPTMRAAIEAQLRRLHNMIAPDENPDLEESIRPKVEPPDAVKVDVAGACKNPAIAAHVRYLIEVTPPLSAPASWSVLRARALERAYAPLAGLPEKLSATAKILVVASLDAAVGFAPARHTKPALATRAAIRRLALAPRTNAEGKGLPSAVDSYAAALGLPLPLTGELRMAAADAWLTEASIVARKVADTYPGWHLDAANPDYWRFGLANLANLNPVDTGNDEGATI